MKDFIFQARFSISMARSGVLSPSWRWVPHHEQLDDETSFAGLQAGIQKAVGDLEKVKREDVDGNEDKKYDLWTEGKSLPFLKFLFCLEC